MAKALSARPGLKCWTVAFAFFWSNFCLLGVLRSSAVIYVAMMEYFNVSREEAAWPSAVFSCFMSFTGIASAYLSHHFSNRSIIMCGATCAALAVSLCCCASRIEHIAVFYGALQGAGIGVIVPLTHVTINQCFTSHRALAMGIAFSGSSAGSFLFPSMAHKILDEYGLPSTFLLLGGIMMQSLIGIAFLKTPPRTTAHHTKSKTNGNPKQSANHFSLKEWCQNEDKRTESDNKTKSLKITDVDLKTSNKCPSVQGGHWQRLKNSLVLTGRVLTNATFIIVSGIFSVYFSVSAIFLMVIVDFVKGMDLTTAFGVFLVSAFSLGDLVGRLACGWIGDLRYISRSTFVRCVLILMGGLLLVLPWCRSYATLSTASVLLGLMNGCIIVNYSALLAECLGMEKLAVAVGFSSGFVALTAFMRPIVIGYFRDQQQSYNFLFVSLGALQIILSIMWLIEEELRKVKVKSGCIQEKSICANL